MNLPCLIDLCLVDHEVHRTADSTSLSSIRKLCNRSFVLASQRHIHMNHQLLILLIILRIPQALRLSLHAQQRDDLNIDTGIILKRARHAELAVRVREVDLRNSVLDNRHAVVKVKRALSLAVETGSDDDVETLGPQRSRGVRAFDALRVDDAALVVDRDVGEVDFSSDVFALAANGLACSPLVENVVGEVVFYARTVFFCYWADEDAVAEEELQVDGVRVGVLGVVEEQRIQSRRAGLVLLVDGCVQVVQKLVADGHGVAGCLGDHGPAVGFLAGGGDFGVVAIEWVGQGAEREPSVQ